MTAKPTERIATSESKDLRFGLAKSYKSIPRGLAIVVLSVAAWIVLVLVLVLVIQLRTPS